MAVVDLMLLSYKHEVIICEGDLDCEQLFPVLTHAVYLVNRGTSLDWFDRPDHTHMIYSVKNRTDITDDEKEKIIANAYNSINQNPAETAHHFNF